MKMCLPFICYDTVLMGMGNSPAVKPAGLFLYEREKVELEFIVVSIVGEGH